MAMLSKSFESFIATVNSIIAEHAPLRKISIKERKKEQSLGSQKTYKPQSTTKTKHMESIAEQKTKLEEMSCTTDLKYIEIKLIR